MSMIQHELYSKEQLKQATSVNIVEYLSAHGYRCDPHGHNEYHIRGFGGLYVNTDNNVYYSFTEWKGGYGAISFLQDYCNMKFREAVRELIGDNYNHIDINKMNEVRGKDIRAFFTNGEKKEFSLPKRDNNLKRVYAYLINTRKISPDVINALVHDHSLYQDKSGNAVFIHKDENGNAIGAQMHGTLSEKRFKKNIGVGEFAFDKGRPDTAYIFESTIDMMSFIQMHPDIDNAKFVSMAGLKHSIAFKMAEQGFKIVSCVDNDENGQKFNERLQENGIGLTSKLSAMKVEKEPQQYEDIKFYKCNVNDTVCYFFASQDDCKKVCENQKLYGRIFQSSNADNCFTINKECELAEVKDFNELLVKKASPVAEKDIQSLSNLMKSAHKKHTEQQNSDSMDRGQISGER